MKIKNKAFTLVEIMFGILIAGGVLIVAFDVVSKVSFGKIKLIDSSNIEKETFFFSQRLYETIKKGGILDYEEYWDRKVVGNTSYSSGHYDKKTGFGNFGDGGNIGTTTYGNGFYYCRSGNGVNMGTGGCETTNNDADGKKSSDIKDYSGKPQRYGEYSFQFIDYNSNADSDLGDEDGDDLIIGDDDDEYLGNGPSVFTGGTNVKELYLISADKITRTFLRLNYILDPNAPSGTTCTSSDGGKTYTGTGCLGQLEMLKLHGVDWGLNHDKTTVDSDGSQYDGVIDTWLINKDFVGKSDYSSSNAVIAGSNNINYWLPMFSNNINVVDFKVYPYPNKDIKKAWKDNSVGTNVSPYVRLDLTLEPSWKIKKRIKGKVPEFKYSTTISLSDIYSR